MSSSVFRIDKFVVPAGGKDEFLRRVGETHALLRKLPGFVRDLVVEKVGGPGEFNYVTLVEWESEGAFSSAKQAVHEFHAARNFDPQAMWSRLGIAADLANYKSIGL